MRVSCKKHRWLIVGVALILGSAAMSPRTQSGAAEGERKPAKTSIQSGNHANAVVTAGQVLARVAVVKPHKGGMARSTTQPGTMESFDFADLYAKISGYVELQSVDIGDMVSTGDVLAKIDAPEFEEALHEAEAAQAQAEAQVAQMKARVNTANAEFDAAESNIALAEAELAKAESYLNFRKIQFDRVSELYKLKSIDERLVDEKHEQRDAAQAAENSARAAIVSARSQAIAAKARVASAEADVVDAQAKVRLSKSRVSRAQVFVNYTKIVSPYNGVVTRRSFHVGDFIRAADQGGAIPLLTVARTDVMRVIVQVPDRDVPYTNVGDPAVVEMETLAGEKFVGKVSRISNSEDRVTRTMRAEIDLKNPKNRLRDGMYGRITISLDDGANGLTVPSSSVFLDRKSKKSTVFVVKNGKVHRTPVEIGQDDGKTVEILSGLSPEDHVVRQPPGDLNDNTPVEIEEVAGNPVDGKTMAKESVAKNSRRD
jgi:RND family efflux transporter MFP subunit